MVLALSALTWLTRGPRGPVCADIANAQPGFAALTSGHTPACIRIRLR